MKALITGGAGFIGSHLADYLLEKGYSVTALDNLSTGSKKNIGHLLKNKNFKLVDGDILDETLVKKLVSEVEEVYHLAAALGVKNIMEKPLESLITNIKGTEIVLEAVANKKVKTFIASTSEVYGKQTGVLLTEDSDRVYGSTTTKRWSYADGKAVDEFLALGYHDEKDLPIVIGRLFNTVGPRQTGQYGMVIPRFVNQALKNEPLTVYNDGSMVRSFTYVGDAVEAIYGLMIKENTIGEVFNIGNGKTITIKRLAEKIIKMTNSQSVIEYIPYEEVFGKGFEDMQERKPSIAKINQYIGYDPKVNLDEILVRTIDYNRKFIVEGAYS